MDASPSEADLEQAAWAITNSMLPGGGDISLSTADVVRSQTMSTLLLQPPETRALVLSAHIMTMLSADKPSEAIAIVESISDDELNRMRFASPLGAAALDAAIADAYLGFPDATRALFFAQRLLAHVSGFADGRWRPRALGILARCWMHLGEEGLATAAIDEANRHSSDDEPAFAVVAAELMLTMSTLDEERLSSLRPRLDSLSRRLELARPLARTAHAVELFLTDRHDEVAPFLSSPGSDIEDSPSTMMLRGLDLAIIALAFQAQGLPYRALAILDRATSGPTHFPCFESIRAGALLQLDRPLLALQVTSGCVNHPHHDVWSASWAHIRRAVAYLRLGSPAQAVRTVAPVFAGAATRRSLRTAALLLRQQDLEDLLGLIASDRARAAVAEEYRTLTAGMAIAPPAAVIVPQLSPQEQLLAERLREDRPLTRIAEDLHISLSTAKTRARSIARGLGVDTRTDAVSLLEDSGWFLAPAEFR